jgi:hypothetical protein
MLKFKIQFIYKVAVAPRPVGPKRPVVGSVVVVVCPAGLLAGKHLAEVHEVVRDGVGSAQGLKKLIPRRLICFDGNF